MHHKFTRLAALGLAAALAAPLALAQGTLRIGMTASDIPLTTGQTDQGGEGMRFMGYTVYDALINWDLSSADKASVISALEASTWSDSRQFDAVLLDAPCSATGTYRRNPDVMWAARPGDIPALALVQARLLDSATARVRPGGQLVYCVCSLEPEEGEAQVQGFLARTPEFSLDPVQPGEGGSPVQSRLEDGSLRILPHHRPGGTDGFYIPATLTGHLYVDTDGNGTQDVGEPNIANVNVVITDSNGATQTVVTDANGNWTATVPPGTTIANVDEADADFIAVVPAGYVQTEGSDPTSVVAVANASTSAGNDGYYIPATVTGHLYVDTNGNGTQDVGEPNLAGVNVDIIDVNGGNHGKAFATNFNPEINIREVTAPARRWEKGEWVETPALTIKQTFDFEAVGPKNMYLMYHEELESLQKHLPEIARIRFWMTFGDSYLKHLEVLENIGMTRIDPVRFQGQDIVPIQFLKALLPEPSSLGPLTKGKTNIGTIATGVKDGQAKTVYINNVCDHEEAYAETGNQAVSYTTGVPAMIGAAMLLTGAWKGEGVFNMEQLDPDPFMAMLNQQGLPWKVQYLAAPLAF